MTTTAVATSAARTILNAFKQGLSWTTWFRRQRKREMEEMEERDDSWKGKIQFDFGNSTCAVGKFNNGTL
jgi:hypothetical protein